MASYRRTRAVELRAQGKDYAEIARELGYANKGTAHKVIAQALQAREANSVDLLRTLELERLDAIHAAIWDAAMGGRGAGGHAPAPKARWDNSSATAGGWNRPCWGQPARRQSSARTITVPDAREVFAQVVDKLSSLAVTPAVADLPSAQAGLLLTQRPRLEAFAEGDIARRGYHGRTYVCESPGGSGAGESRRVAARGRWRIRPRLGPQLGGLASPSVADGCGDC